MCSVYLMSKRKIIEDLECESNTEHYKRLVNENYLQYLKDISEFKHRGDAKPVHVSVYEYGRSSAGEDTATSNFNLSSSDDDSEFMHESDNVDTRSYFVESDTSHIESKVEVNHGSSLRKDLAVMFVQKQTPVSHVNGILKILNDHKDDSPRQKLVPKTRATLVKTPKQKITTRPLATGTEYYSGIRKALKNRQHLIKDLTELEIDIGIDGAKMDNSSKAQIWPTMGCITNKKNIRPFLIAIKMDDILNQDITNFPSQNQDQIIHQSTRVSVINRKPTLIKLSKNSKGFTFANKELILKPIKINNENLKNDHTPSIINEQPNYSSENVDCSQSKKPKLPAEDTQNISSILHKNPENVQNPDSLTNECNSKIYKFKGNIPFVLPGSTFEAQTPILRPITKKAYTKAMGSTTTITTTAEKGTNFKEINSHRPTIGNDAVILPFGKSVIQTSDTRISQTTASYAKRMCLTEEPNTSTENITSHGTYLTNQQLMIDKTGLLLSVRKSEANTPRAKIIFKTATTNTKPVCLNVNPSSITRNIAAAKKINSANQKMMLGETSSQSYISSPDVDVAGQLNKNTRKAMRSLDFYDISNQIYATSDSTTLREEMECDINESHDEPTNSGKPRKSIKKLKFKKCFPPAPKFNPIKISTVTKYATSIDEPQGEEGEEGASIFLLPENEHESQSDEQTRKTTDTSTLQENISTQNVGLNVILDRMDNLEAHNHASAIQQAQLIVGVSKLNKAFTRYFRYNDEEDHEVEELLPLRTLNQFMDIQFKMNNDHTFKTKMFNYLHGFKGPKVPGTFCSITNTFMTDELMYQFNYGGIKNKLKLEDKTIMKIVHDIHKPMHKEDFEKIMKNTIKASKVRHRSRLFRLKQKGNDGLDENYQ